MQLSRRGAIAFAGHRPKYKSRSFAAEARLLVYLGFGRRQAILSEQGFRRALSHAIDRQGMKHIGYGEAIVPTRTPDAKARRKTAMGANKGLAGRELLTLASRYSDIEASRLQLELLVNASRPEDIDVAGRIAAALYSFGIGVKIQSLPAQIFRKRVDKGDCELYVGQLAQSSSNELQQYRQSFLLPGATQSVPTKLRTIAQLEAFFRKTQPILPLFYKGQKIHTRSDLWETRFDEGQRPRFETMYFDGPIREN